MAEARDNPDARGTDLPKSRAFGIAHAGRRPPTVQKFSEWGRIMRRGVRSLVGGLEWRAGGAVAYVRAVGSFEGRTLPRYLDISLGVLAEAYRWQGR